MDECRSLALRNNKQIAVSRLKQDNARNAKEIARTMYLPKVDAVASYIHTSKEVSILNDDQKGNLSGLGTNLTQNIGNALSSEIKSWSEQQLISPDMAQKLSEILGRLKSDAAPIANILDGIGEDIVDAFRTDTRNIWVGSVLLTQPVYMGGRLTALNKIAEINQDLTANQTEAKEQEVLINTDRAYWLVVSLKHKQKLANQYLDLLKKLDSDVQKMIKEGVATKANGLSVSVKVNEAEMSVTQVNNGVSLSKMALCQVCGLPIDSDITLADEDDVDITDNLDVPVSSYALAVANRPEIKMLENAGDIAQQGVKIARAGYLPMIALSGGYTISNPNVLNGFQKKFSGLWNIGVAVKIPVWNWFETRYKIRAAKVASNIQNMQLSDAKELIHLQVNQNQFKVSEAQKKVAMTKKNISSAEENLRAATLGFQEGVMTTSNVLEAQTAWLQAQTQKIDAEIELRLCAAELKKSLGVIKY